MASSVGTLDSSFSYPVVCSLGRRGKTAPFDAVMTQHRQTQTSIGPNGQAALRTWQLRYEHQNKDDYVAFKALFLACVGGALPLDLTVRGFDMDGSSVSETIQVRLLDDPLRVISVSPTRFSWTISVEEFPHAP